MGSHPFLQPEHTRPSLAHALWSGSNRSVIRNAVATLSAVLLLVTVTSCGNNDEDENGPPRELSVLYAGSLATVMEDGLGPAYTKLTGTRLRGEAHGSLGAAQLIRDGLRTPDVFISADPAVNEEILMGRANGDKSVWYGTFASSELVLGYSPRGPYADKFADIAAGRSASQWYDLLSEPDVRFGRGDPAIDPKGYRTLIMLDLATRHYGDPRLETLLGSDENPAQVLPEVSLMARVEAGQFDSGFFYRHEAVAAGLPFITLPDEINLGNAALSDLYSTAAYITPAGVRVPGAPILFTVTVLRGARHPKEGEEFIKFLVSDKSRLASFGFSATELAIAGDASAAPPVFRSSNSGRSAP